MSGIGVNILAGGDYDEPRLLAWLDRLQPPALVVLNNAGLAGRLATRYPGAVVVYRHWPDDNANAIATPDERWRLLDGLAPRLPNIYLYTQNEPGYTATCAAWEVEMIARADAAGRALVVLNAGMGGPEDADWRGPLTPLLRALAESNARRRERGLPPHLLGLHEYADCHNWRAPGYDPLAGETWLIGRFRRLLAICADLGIDPPPILITEHGMDSLRSEYHGWRAGAGLSEAEYARQISEMDRLVYRPAPEVVGQCVYCWEPSGGNWSTYNIKDAPALQDALAQYAQEARMAEMTLMTATVLTAVKRRSSPAITGAVIGTLEPGVYTLQVGPEISAGGYVWRYMMDDRGNAWYSATGPTDAPTQWITLTPAPVTPPDPPEQPEQPAAPDWELYLQQMQAVMRAWHDTLARMEALLAALQAQMADLRNTLVETWPDIAGDLEARQ